MVLCGCSAGVYSGRVPFTMIEVLCDIANRAGSPTMDYSPENALKEQRASLDWIAARAAEGIKAVKVSSEELEATLRKWEGLVGEVEREGDEERLPELEAARAALLEVLRKALAGCS